MGYIVQNPYVVLSKVKALKNVKFGVFFRKPQSLYFTRKKNVFCIQIQNSRSFFGKRIFQRTIKLIVCIFQKKINKHL